MGKPLEHGQFTDILLFQGKRAFGGDPKALDNKHLNGCERCIAAEMRLGMWENGRFVGYGLADLVEKTRHGKPLTRDEWVVMHAGFSTPGRDI